MQEIILLKKTAAKTIGANIFPVMLLKPVPIKPSIFYISSFPAKEQLYMDTSAKIQAERKTKIARSLSISMKTGIQKYHREMGKYHQEIGKLVNKYD